jgi:hypothetical protein
LQPHNFEFVLKNGAPPGQRDELNIYSTVKTSFQIYTQMIDLEALPGQLAAGKTSWGYNPRAGHWRRPVYPISGDQSRIRVEFLLGQK